VRQSSCTETKQNTQPERNFCSNPPNNSRNTTLLLGRQHVFTLRRRKTGHAIAPDALTSLPHAHSSDKAVRHCVRGPSRLYRDHEKSTKARQ